MTSVPHVHGHAPSLLLRLWHWTTALALTGSLLTVLLRKTVFSWRTNGPLIEASVLELGGSITPDAAVQIAKRLRAPMWDWHYLFGFALVALLLVRLLVTLRSRQESPLHVAAATWRAARAPGGWSSPAALHLLWVKSGYVVFYGVLAVVAVTGSVLYFQDALGLTDSTAGTFKDVHELLLWFFVAFVPVHLLGVIVAELRFRRGLVSAMIHGARAGDG